MPSPPSYLKLARTGKLQKISKKLQLLLKECSLCPRLCKVDRLSNKKGICRTGALARVANYNAHYGEETPLVGSGGSGAIFFNGCNLGCVFCQNYDISHNSGGVEVSAGQLASIMVSLQKQGCHNINFVTPSHVVPQIVAALPFAIEKGLSIPLIYNTSGYDSLQTLQLLDGIFDIYMPDFKFWSGKNSQLYCNAKDYPKRAREALIEMHRQVGDLQINANGVAEKGLLVRHLVMPGVVDETGEIAGFIAQKLSKNTYVNIMEQYHPCFKASEFPAINRVLGKTEYDIALSSAKKKGLIRLDRKDMDTLLRSLGLI